MSGERKPHSWSSGDAYLWARKQEGANANPPNPTNRPGKGDGLLGDTPTPTNQAGVQFPGPAAGPPPLHPS
eukprot:550416-Rhodomonas_salina.1